MSNETEGETAPPSGPTDLVTLCAWSNTVRYESEWMTFSTFLERRFGVMTTHDISPSALAKLDAEDLVLTHGALNDPKTVVVLRFAQGDNQVVG